MKKLELLTKNKILRKIFKNALIAYILGDIATVIGPLVDSAIIANYLGVEAVAAVGLFSPFLMFIAIIGGVIAGGSRALYTNLIGKGEINKANFVFTFSCIMAMVISPIVAFIGIAFPDQLASFLGASGEQLYLRPYLSAYVRGYLLGVPFLSTARVLSGYMHLDHDSARPVYSLVIMTIVNIIGNLIVAFVIKGDLFGIALATSIANVVWFLVLCGHFLRKDRELKFNLSEIKNALVYIKDVALTGSSAAVTRLSKMFAGLIINRLLAAYANVIAIAAFSAQKSVTSLLGSLYLGVADTVWVLSGIYYGEEDRSALDELQVYATKIGLMITVSVGIIVFIAAKYIAGVYVGFGNVEALKSGAESVRMFALTLPIYVITFSFADYLISVKKIHMANIYMFLMQFGVVVPIAFVFIKLLGARGAWISTPVSAAIMLVIAFVYICSYKINSNSFNDKRLLVPLEFGRNYGSKLEITATTLLEIVGMSRAAELFCMENKVSDITSYKLALFIEELGTNIISYGFRDYISYEISLSMVVKEEELILRIRDNCTPFNPVERYNMKIKNDNDISKNIGIRMVMKMCKSVNYICTYNTNNLIVKLPIKDDKIMAESKLKEA